MEGFQFSFLSLTFFLFSFQEPSKFTKFSRHCISSRVEIFSTRVEIFQIIAIFFNSVYRAEISTRNENLHIMNH